MIDFIIDIANMIFGWVGKSTNQGSLIQSFSCIIDSKDKTYSESVLSEECVKEIYKWIEKGIGQEIKISYEKAKTINEIWIELYRIQKIDIKKQEIIDIINYIEKNKK